MPLARRVAAPSSWVNCSNTSGICSAGMPIPVSVTLHRSRTRSRVADAIDTAIETRPSSVNLTALPARLSSTWRRRPPSASTRAGHVGPTAAVHLQPLLRGHRPQQADDVVHQGADVDPLRHEIELARLDLREVEDVVDDRQQRLRRPERDAHPLALLVGERLLEQQLEHAGDAVHRRADLVAHVGQELGLEPRVLDRLLPRLDERLLGRLAVADVAQDAGEEALVPDAPLAARQLEGDLAAVLAQAGHPRRADRHRDSGRRERRRRPTRGAGGRARARASTTARPPLPAARSRRAARRPGLANRIWPVVVDGHDGVGRRVGQQPVLRLANRQRLVRLRQQRRVTAERHQPHDLARDALQRRELRRTEHARRPVRQAQRAHGQAPVQHQRQRGVEAQMGIRLRGAGCSAKRGSARTSSTTIGSAVESSRHRGCRRAAAPAARDPTHALTHHRVSSTKAMQACGASATIAATATRSSKSASGWVSMMAHERSASRRSASRAIAATGVIAAPPGASGRRR